MLVPNRSNVTAFAFKLSSFLSVGTVQEETELSHEVLDATIISSNFWPPIQVWYKAFIETIMVTVELN